MPNGATFPQAQQLIVSGKATGSRSERDGCLDCADALALLNALRQAFGIGSRALRLKGPGAGMLHARHLEEGLDQVKVVIRRQVRDWGGRPEMHDYLHPGTLFRPGNFERYACSSKPLAFTPDEERRGLGRGEPEAAPEPTMAESAGGGWRECRARSRSGCGGWAEKGSDLCQSCQRKANPEGR